MLVTKLIANSFFDPQTDKSTLLAHGKESFGLLVLLGYDITAFTPVAYQGRSLQPPLKEI